MVRDNTVRLVAALLAAAACVGCAPSVESRLIGTWKPADDVVPLAEAQLTFSADHRYSLVVSSLLGSSSFEGDWEYLRPEGESHLLSVRPDGASSFDERSFRMPTADTLETDWEPLGTLRLVRVVPKP